MSGPFAFMPWYSEWPERGEIQRAANEPVGTRFGTRQHEVGRRPSGGLFVWLVGPAPNCVRHRLSVARRGLAYNGVEV
jgi:hypothetical protein